MSLAGAPGSKSAVPVTPGFLSTLHTTPQEAPQVEVPLPALQPLLPHLSVSGSSWLSTMALKRMCKRMMWLQVMVLDTLERLSGANKLYAALGFELCQRYNDNPLPGVLYFARRLDTE